MSIEPIAQIMAELAVVLPDESGLYYGSPRRIMEDIGASSGPAYHALYKRGIIPIRRGKRGIWRVPPDIMQRYRH